MRLYLLPISNRRTLLYCRRLNVSISDHPTFIDRGTTRAAKLWADWETKDSGWRKKVVDWGNTALKKIPYEEWGLKSIPPLSARRRAEELEAGQATVEVSFPSGVIPMNEVSELLRRLGTERESLHKSRLVYCFVGMPITAPVALLPVIPNLPFFYLVYRAWSHWRALSGSKHIQFLISKELIAPTVSPILDTLYAPGIMRATRGSISLGNKPPKSADSSAPLLKDQLPHEVMLLQEGDSTLIANALEMPELHAEIERAIWQVRNDIRTKQEAKDKENQKDEVKEEDKDKK
ncbi:hypothetical protein V499_06640 [Pseudogymnoascus sp. VKM F-103]|uniref:Mitochondrial K+-H+ exchange-related-domain-containing protein n=1 Tax=Pseudogymnoascus verrucosus TaxID=342668 RepID=A0A1B8GK69_9PEZI|nr:uncharacterized protein VE01_06914 [Pseudogymnoascus verrucosus]KFY73264.1 hypothetical protein V499_06640 [Pseudogymnoascus sp. VKM F-103]OBT96186.1 hypothetical protein VE01_06914 [Pseudogymnoascus verrucosus]